MITTYSMSIKHERWPLKKPFTISRGTKNNADVIIVEIKTNTGLIGRAECVPYLRYNETINRVIKQLEGYAQLINENCSRTFLSKTIPAGAARNALDCALWDLEAKRTHKRVWELANIASSRSPYLSSVTIDIDSLEVLAERAKELSNLPLLKIKLGSDNIITSIATIRENAPRSRLIVDANESWTFEILHSVAEPLANLGVELIEQPLPADNDGALLTYRSPVPLCADESCHTSEDLNKLKGKYQFINIKLDKSGGLTEALLLAQNAPRAGFKTMVGCMVGTSLSIAPATIIGEYAEFVDLDGALHLKQDREINIDFVDGRVSLPKSGLWG